MTYSGTLVTHGQAAGVVVATGAQTEIGHISTLVSEVESVTTPLLRQIAQFGRGLTIAILVLAILTIFFGSFIRDYTVTEMFLAAVSLVVAAIPEGLPAILTITLAIGVQEMARRNTIVRRLPAIETLGSVSVICTDKTGTLTIGKPKVYEIVKINNASEEQILELASSIESRSEHPLGDAIVQYANEKNITFSAINDFESIPGRGAKAKINGQIYYIGSIALFKGQVNGLAIAKEEIKRLQDEGKTTVLLGMEEEILGLVAIADQIRPEAKEAILKLRRKGVEKIIMLTGDNEGTAPGTRNSKHEGPCEIIGRKHRFR